jgi:hypothetical protein
VQDWRNGTPGSFVREEPIDRRQEIGSPERLSQHGVSAECLRHVEKHGIP